MRIIAGSLRGRILKTVEGPGYRPATARVREAVFSMLESRGVVWSGVRVLDLYAGSGSLGFEAISRGSPEVCLVEKAATAVECLRKNVESLHIPITQCHVVADDVMRFLRVGGGQQYDIVFIDPPYGENKLPPTMTTLLRENWLAPQSFVVAEIEAFLPIEPLFTGKNALIRPEIDRTYGQTRILLWNLSPKE